MATVTLRGNPVEVAGQLPQPGQQAPAFSLVGADLADVSLASLAGKVLQQKSATEAAKKLAGSVLTQAPDRKPSGGGKKGGK